MSIQRRFDELKPYLKGVKIADKYTIVEIHIKARWNVPKSDKINFESKDLNDTTNKYYMFYAELSIDDLLDYVENEIIDKNIEIEKKEALLKDKMTELKKYFQTHSIDELEKLEFNITEAFLGDLQSSKEINEVEKKSTKKVLDMGVEKK